MGDLDPQVARVPLFTLFSWTGKILLPLLQMWTLSKIICHVHNRRLSMNKPRILFSISKKAVLYLYGSNATLCLLPNFYVGRRPAWGGDVNCFRFSILIAFF